MAMKRTASDILAEQHWKRRILSIETSYMSQPEPSVEVNTDSNNALESQKASVSEGPDAYSYKTEEVSCAEDNGEETSKCCEAHFEIQDVPPEEMACTSAENGLPGENQPQIENGHHSTPDLQHNQHAVTQSLLGLPENQQGSVSLESETSHGITCASDNIASVKEPVIEMLIIVPEGSEDCNASVSPQEEDDPITADVDQGNQSGQNSWVIDEVGNQDQAQVSSNTDTDDTTTVPSEDQSVDNSDACQRNDGNQDLHSLEIGSVIGSISGPVTVNFAAGNGDSSNKLVPEASVEAKTSNDLENNTPSVQFIHDTQNAGNNPQENACHASPGERSAETSEPQPNVVLDTYVPVSQSAYMHCVAESSKEFQGTAQSATLEQCYNAFQTPEVSKPSSSDQPVTSAAEYIHACSDVNAQLHQVQPETGTVSQMPAQVPWQMNSTSQLPVTCNSTVGIPAQFANTVNCASEQHLRSGFSSHAHPYGGYPDIPHSQLMEQNHVGNYQHFLMHGQPVLSQQNGDQLLIGQPQVASAVHQMQNPAGLHHTGQHARQPNPANDHAYRKNEGSAITQQKATQAPHVTQGIDHYATTLFHPGDVMQNTNGNSAFGIHKQLPDLMLRNSDLGGPEAVKENFYGMNQNIATNNGNFHSHQALASVNVHQYWSAPRHGTPICSTKPYGPPGHYRPAPYTFPACMCTGSPMSMPACRNCHMGHNNIPTTTRHPRSFNSSYTEYTCRGDHKAHPRRSASCFHIGQQKSDCSLHADDEISPVTPSFTPKSRRRQMGDFNMEGARYHNREFQSNSWHSTFSHSSDFSSDSDSPMLTSRAQPGLGSTGDINSLRERHIPENSLTNPNNPVFKNLPPPGLQRTKFLVSTYIDYLVEENERITDMSKAFTPPTYLFLEEEQYVLQAHKEEVPFPSNQFSRWIKQYFPQVDAISVPEGRSKENSTNISRLNLAEKSFNEFAHTVFFGCQDIQEKGKAMPVHTPMPAKNPPIMSLPQPQPQALTGN